MYLKHWRNKIIYGNIYDIEHFCLLCDKTKQFWWTWAKWWKNLSGLDITKYKHINEGILFRLPRE